MGPLLSIAGEAAVESDLLLRAFSSEVETGSR
jgi:hypothetical protein